MDINFEKATLNKQSRSLTKMAQSTRRLNSGYRINSAADDAAGLAVSEKMRSITRGLQQGLENISDGKNFLATQDTAEQVINDTLHRMKEIAVEAANGPLSRMDREALDLEYQQLLDEIGQITETGDFNGVPLFDRHMPKFSKFEGNIMHDEFIEIFPGENSPLVIEYEKDGNSCQISVDIPIGRYSVDEIADLIDDELYVREPSLIIGVNDKNQFSLQCEGGHVNYITGPGRKLFYDMTEGSAGGYMIGVTKFTNDVVTMDVVEGANDVLNFRIEGDKSDNLYSIKVDSGAYTYPKLIENINEKLKDAGLQDVVKAIPYRDGKYTVIGLSSDKAITGLEGNFLYLGDEFSSPLYDIADYSKFENTPAEFNGGKELTANIDILRDRNDYFVMKFSYYVGDDKTDNKTVKVNLLDDGENTKTFTRAELAARINDQIAEAFKDEETVPVAAVIKDDGTIYLETTQFGDECKIELKTDDVPSDYMVYDLFKTGNQAKIMHMTDSSYAEAFSEGEKNISNVIIDADHDTLQYTVIVEDPQNKNQKTITLDLKLDHGTYSGSGIITELNNKLQEQYQREIDGLGLGSLKTKIEFVPDGSGLKLTAKGEEGTAVDRIILNTDQNISTAYRRVIRGVEYLNSATPTDGRDGGSYKDINNTTNVQYTVGAGAREDFYSPCYNPSTPRKENPYLTYTYEEPTAEDGKPAKGLADLIEGKRGDPAKLTYGNASSQFIDIGDGSGKKVCLRDTNVKFTLNKPGGAVDVNVSVPKGSTLDDLSKAITDASGGAVTVEQQGGGLIITSTGVGSAMKFSNFGGNLGDKVSTASSSGKFIDYDNNKVITPPSLTLPFAGSQYPIDISRNNTIVLDIGGTKHTITLKDDDGDNKISLKDVEKQINDVLGDAGKANASGSTLIITGGKDTTGKIVYDPSSTLKLDQQFHPSDGVEKPGSAVLYSAGDHADLLYGTSDKTVNFKYTIPGEGTKSVSVTIQNMQGKSIYDLRDAIEDNLPSEHKGKIVISVENGGLKIATVGKGAGYAVTDVGGTANLDKTVTKNNTDGGKIDYANNKVYFPADIKNPSYGALFNDPGMEIITGVNDKIKITVTKLDGSKETNEITLDPGIYDYSKKSTVDSKLRAAFGGVFNISTGGTLTMTTWEQGNGTKISIDGTTAPIFKTPYRDAAPFENKRDYILCEIRGNVDVNGMKISDYDNTMTFTYSSPSNNGMHDREVTITLEPNESYTAEKLRENLQTAIDAELGAGQLVVTNDGGKITIKGATITNDRSITDFKGPLYDKILRGPTFTETRKYVEVPGDNKGDKQLAYIIGRNQMEPETIDEIKANCNVVIYPELNDKLTFDMKYDEVVSVDDDGTKNIVPRSAEINITLPSGEYDRQKIADTIQELTRKELEKNGTPFNPDFFKATIGLAPLGIKEPENLAVKTENTLILSYKSPDDGSVEYDHVKIEGIRGTLAYRVFYKASQTPCPTQVLGNADISEGVAIKSGINDIFTVTYEGEPITVKIPSGSYSSEEIVKFLNQSYQQMGADLRVTQKGDNLMLFSLENGDFEIDPISGSASYDLFYSGDWREKDESYIGIHSGRRTGSYIWYEKTRLDQHLMRINTTGVTTVERALKAIDRIDGANNYLLHWRALNGANENRSTRTYERNAIQIENLTRSESDIRDADIPTELSNLKKQQLIQQFQNNVAQQNKQTITDMVLNQLNQRG